MLYSNKNVRVLLSYYIISYRTYYILFGYIKKYQLVFRQAGVYEGAIQCQWLASLGQWPTAGKPASGQPALGHFQTIDIGASPPQTPQSRERGKQVSSLRSQPAYNVMPSSFSLSCFLSSCLFLTSSLTAFLTMPPIILSS